MSPAGFEPAIPASDRLEQNVTEESKHRPQKQDVLEMYVNSRVPSNNLLSTLLWNDPQNSVVFEVHRLLSTGIGQKGKKVKSSVETQQHVANASERCSGYMKRNKKCIIWHVHKTSSRYSVITCQQVVLSLCCHLGSHTIISTSVKLWQYKTQYCGYWMLKTSSVT
jgi:hypothetical protein